MPDLTGAIRLIAMLGAVDGRHMAQAVQGLRVDYVSLGR